MANKMIALARLILGEANRAAVNESRRSNRAAVSYTLVLEILKVKNFETRIEHQARSLKDKIVMMETTFGSSTSTSTSLPVSTSTNLQIQALQDIKALVDSHKHLQMQNSVALGAIMGGIEVRIQKSQDAGKSNAKAQLSKDVGQDRLQKAAEGPCQDQEFNELLSVLRLFLHNNYATYKKALANNINLIRVVVVEINHFLEKRIIANVNDCGLDRCLQDTQLLKELKNAQIAAFPEAYLHPSRRIAYICSQTRKCRHFTVPKNCNLGEIYSKCKHHVAYNRLNLKDDKDDDEQKHDEQKPSGSNPSQSSRATGSKDKKQDEKKDGDKKRGEERRSKKSTLMDTFSPIEIKRVEGGVRGQRPPGVCLDGRPPPVVNECPHWGCEVKSGVCFGSSVSVVNGCPRWETLEYPALCTQNLGIACPVIW
ncbi:hypothetical protein AgCh_030254 [Apium graveolens]